MRKIILTNHARQRLRDRKIPESQILQAISSPDSKVNNIDGTIEFAREFGNQKAHAIVKENEKGEYIVLSCWINPPNHGTKDFKSEKLYKDKRNASGIKKIWLTLLNQFGI